MKVSTENDNNFGYEKITIVVDNIPLKLVLEKLLKVLEKSWNFLTRKVYEPCRVYY
jgi:hypothetical protein